MDMSKYRDMFLSETREHLDKMSRFLVELEKAPDDRERIDALFREAHSIKGMAASMGYPQMTALAHHLEDFLDGFRSGGEVPVSAVDRLLGGCDLLEALLGDISAERPERDISGFVTASQSPGQRVAGGEEEPGDLAQSSPDDGAPAASTVFDIAVEFADQVIAPAARALLVLRDLEGCGELLESRPSQRQLARGEAPKTLRVRLQSAWPSEQIEELLGGMPEVKSVSCGSPVIETALQRRRRDDAERTVRIRTDLLDQFISLTGELLTNRYQLRAASSERNWARLDEGLDQLTRLLGDLHHRVRQVRMMPLESITGRLPRLLRDLCRQTGKQIDLEVCGDEIELDRTILEALADPLVHLVRNAVDHGIQHTGSIVLRAWREKDLVLVEVADDGIGMDPELIRSRAIERGLISRSQAKQLTPADTYLLVCRPGFSTRDTVTETSGRGVGMDVVKAAVDGLGGQLEISSSPGGGTRILLRLPLSVAIIKVLLFELDGHRLALPITRVQRTLEATREELQGSGKQLVLHLGGDALPLLSLRKILQLSPRPHGQSVPIIVTELRNRQVGLVVDRLVGQQEAFIKSLTFPLSGVPGLSGATVLGEGDVVFVIDPQALLEGGRNKPG